MNYNPKIAWKTVLLETQLRDDSRILTETIETWGDLRMLLSALSRRKEIESWAKLGEKGGKLAKAATTFIPFLNIVKAGTEALGGVTTMADTIETVSQSDDNVTQKSSILSALNIDDGYSEILDDRLEQEFIDYLSQEFQEGGQYSGEKSIPADWNINRVLEDWLKERGSHDETVADGDEKGNIRSAEIPDEYEESLQGLWDAAKQFGKAWFF